MHNKQEMGWPAGHPIIFCVILSEAKNLAVSLGENSSGKLKLMVLKHAPLGEINLPFVASSANAPRCRRNRRQTESRDKLA